MSARELDPLVARILPRPRSWRASGPGCVLGAQARIALPAGEERAAEQARALLARALEALSTGPRTSAPIELVLLEELDAPSSREAYRLRVGAGGLRLEARTHEGLFRAAASAAQLVLAAARPRAAGGGAALPGLALDDAPVSRVRGYSLDLSRDKLPRLEELLALIERLARWKLNRLELYLEHAFAHPGHETVWREASPLTPAELAALERFARERFVELVPCQQSLGHMHRWLKHDAYRHLAEVPEGLEHPFSLEREPYGLCPLDPEAFALVDSLHAGLAELCASEVQAVGLDEPIDLGRGRSRAECERRGAPALYLDWTRALAERLAARGRRMELYADYALAEPEVLAGLPREASAVAWGYEASHDFAPGAEALAARGLEVLLAPGTSAWQSLFGRPRNARENLVRASEAARAHGAAGLLVCDWGDRGHWQAPFASLGPLAQAAELAWSGALGASLPPALPSLLAREIFGGEGVELATAWLELGERCERALATTNGDAPFFVLAFGLEPWPHARLPGLDPTTFELLGEAFTRARDALALMPPAGLEARRVAAELSLGLELGELAVAWGRARLSHPPPAALLALPARLRASLGERIEALLPSFSERWLARNRPGGLPDSLRRLTRLLDALGMAAAPGSR